MKKFLLLSSLLFALSLSACGGGNANGDESKGDSNESQTSQTSKDTTSSEDESEEDVYRGYPDNPNGFNVPKSATYAVLVKNSDAEAKIEWNVIIKDDQFYAVRASDNYKLYCKGYYQQDQSATWLHMWMYKTYDYITGWKEKTTLNVDGTLTQFDSQWFFNFTPQTKGTKTGNTMSFNGEACDEYNYSNNLYYYSKTLNICVGYKWNNILTYVGDYSTNAPAIPDKPSSI